MAIEALLKEAKGLSEESVMEVIRFIKFLKQETQNPSYLPDSLPSQQKIRKEGLYKGQIWMSDDFNSPMDEFKEYM